MAKIKKFRHAAAVTEVDPTVAIDAPQELDATVDIADVPSPETDEEPATELADDGTVDLSPSPDPLPPVVSDVPAVAAAEPAEPEPASPVATVATVNYSLSPSPTFDADSPAVMAIVMQPASPFFQLAAEAETAARTSYAIQPIAFDVVLLAQIALSLFRLYQGCVSERTLKRRIGAAVSGNEIMRRRLISRIEDAMPEAVQGHVRVRLSEEILVSSARMPDDKWAACEHYVSTQVQP